MVIPAHEDFGTRSKRNDVDEKLCFENFLKVTEDTHEDNLLEDSFDFDPDNLPKLAKKGTVVTLKTGKFPLFYL